MFGPFAGGTIGNTLLADEVLSKKGPYNVALLQHLSLHVLESRNPPQNLSPFYVVYVAFFLLSNRTTRSGRHAAVSTTAACPIWQVLQKFRDFGIPDSG